jgi:hypothetical protein
MRICGVKHGDMENEVLTGFDILEGIVPPRWPSDKG